MRSPLSQVKQFINYIEGISLRGILWGRIKEIFDNATFTKSELIKACTAYFRFLKYGWYPEGDIPRDPNEVFSDPAHWSYGWSFNMAMNEIPIRRANYLNALITYQKELPFYWEYFGIRQYEFPDTTIRNVELDIIGFPRDKQMLIYIEEANQKEPVFREKHQNLVNMNRLMNMLEKRGKLYTVETPTGIVYCSSLPRETYVSIDDEITIIDEQNLAKREYDTAFEREYNCFFGTVCGYPPKYSFFELPKYPERKNSEDIMLEIENKTLELELIPISEREQWCLDKWRKVNEMFDILEEANGKLEAFDCIVEIFTRGFDENNRENEWDVIINPNCSVSSHEVFYWTYTWLKANYNYDKIRFSEYPTDIYIGLMEISEYTFPTNKHNKYSELKQYQALCLQETPFGDGINIDRSQNCYMFWIKKKDYLEEYYQNLRGGTQKQRELYQAILAETIAGKAWNNPDYEQGEPHHFQKHLFARDLRRTYIKRYEWPPRIPSPYEAFYIPITVPLPPSLPQWEPPPPPTPQQLEYAELKELEDNWDATGDRKVGYSYGLKLKSYTLAYLSGDLKYVMLKKVDFLLTWNDPRYDTPTREGNIAHIEYLDARDDYRRKYGVYPEIPVP